MKNEPIKVWEVKSKNGNVLGWFRTRELAYSYTEPWKENEEVNPKIITVHEHLN